MHWRLKMLSCESALGLNLIGAGYIQEVDGASRLSVDVLEDKVVASYWQKAVKTSISLPTMQRYKVEDSALARLLTVVGRSDVSGRCFEPRSQKNVTLL